MSVAALALLLALSAGGDPAPPLFDQQGRALGTPPSDRVVDYAIEARLDPAAGTLEGRERLTWRNRSREPQRTLWFHLYWNAFANERSAFLRQGRQRFRQVTPERGEKDWGFAEVRSVTAGGKDLTSGLRFRHPEEATAVSLGLPVPAVPERPPDDRTVFTVTLPEAVPPGGQATLDLAWTAQVPRVVARAGRLGDFFMMGQWFPKIGVLEPAGERGAVRPRWNCHPYWHHTEFYADWGRYDVALTVPARMVVGATGALVERREEGGLATWRFHQDDVHDFAWTAWDGFRVAEDLFREPGLPEVRVRLLLHPEHEPAGRQYLEAVKATLADFGRRFTPYPYPTLTVVHAPDAAAEATGMEYPTFIGTAGGRHAVEPRDYVAWMVTAHELGHNWFYGLLASNEFEEAWLDEGLTTWATARVLLDRDVRERPEDFLHPLVRRLWPGAGALALDEVAVIRLTGLGRDPQTPIATPAWGFRGGGDYASGTYARTALAMFSLERLAGREAVDRAMRAYAQRFRFRHPSGADFLAVLEEHLGREWSWLTEQALHRAVRLDYQVDRIACEADDQARVGGLFDDGQGGRTHVDPAKAKGEPTTWRCRVEVSRLGEFRAPVELRVAFDDGSERTERWPLEAQGQEAPRWKRFEYAGPSRVKEARLDPEWKLLLDQDRANDGLSREPDRRVSGRLLGWLGYAFQAGLSLLASLL
jgi:hypothetical protein